MGLPAEKFTTVSVKPYETRKKDGTLTAYKWRAVLQYKDDEDRWRQKNVTLKTEGRDKGRSKQVEKAAQIEAEALRRRLNAEALETPQSHETVTEYFSRYVEGRALSIERSSANELRRILKTHIAPSIGKIELDAITPDDVQEWVTGLSKEYAPSTVKKCLTNLRSAMREAVDRDRLVKDPTRGVKNPKLPTPRPNALDGYGRAKVVRFIALDPCKPLNVAFALAIYMGLREGEICGLRWKSVNLDAQMLEVRETIGRDGSKWYLKEPKTGGSIRTLYIPGTVADALRARRAQVNEERLSIGTKLNELFVVGGADGSYMAPHYLSSRWRIAADALELVGTEGNRPTFHDLRHTFATAAIANGTDVKTVSSILGHANAAMTLNVYATADADAKRRGAQAVERLYQAEAARHASNGQVIGLMGTGTDGQ